MRCVKHTVIRYKEKEVDYMLIFVVANEQR